ncbi:uncharacterized protein LOC116001254 [Ipomoea triloba]|uniref:uncharacterized protein LOC116001254 n=1 Tax=Ipomoea triloba TaxID=35885 RepID=UPI00125DCF70|nr:uncharacterized protein LOC116001254 [Ipomoea triloba]
MTICSIKVVNGVQHLSYRDACYARGLLADDREYIDATNEASEWSSASSMRRLFVTMLTSNAISQPENVWNVVWHHLTEDVKYTQRRLLFDSGLVLNDDEKKTYALIELEKMLKVLNKSLVNFPSMPIPDLSYQFVSGNRLLYKELSYDRDELKREHDSLAKLLFGKLCQLLFVQKINEDSTCNIAQGSDLAELIIKCKLIIWDEAPMMHKHCFEALDRTMRDLMRFENVLSGSLTFGGKTIVLGGDFRQILPVIPKGSRQDIVGANINSSYLWNSCKVRRLTKNLRLQSVGDVDCRAGIENFANWIATIGDGEIGVEDDGHTSIDIPKENLLQISGDPIEAIVNSTFPMFLTDSFDM